MEPNGIDQLDTEGTDVQKFSSTDVIGDVIRLSHCTYHRKWTLIGNDLNFRDARYKIVYVINSHMTFDPGHVFTNLQIYSVELFLVVAMSITGQTRVVDLYTWENKDEGNLLLDNAEGSYRVVWYRNI